VVKNFCVDKQTNGPKCNALFFGEGNKDSRQVGTITLLGFELELYAHMEMLTEFFNRIPEVQSHNDIISGLSELLSLTDMMCQALNWHWF